VRLTRRGAPIFHRSMKYLPLSFMVGILSLMAISPSCGDVAYDDDPIEADGIGTSPSDPDEPDTCVAKKPLADSPM
jgi:hypothetical protein